MLIAAGTDEHARRAASLGPIVWAAAFVWLAGSPAAWAAELERGSTLSARLATRVSSHESRVGDPVEAVLIAPAHVQGEPVLPAGSRLFGHVVEAGGGLGRRARLRLRFDALAEPDGTAAAIDARVSEVDNARESVTEDGTIVGVPPFSSPPSLVHLALLAAAHAHPALLALLEAARYAKERGQRPVVEYGPGVELELRTERSLRVPDRPASPGDPLPAAVEAPLARAVDGLPLRTLSPKANRPADLTNVVLLGTRRQLEAAFLAAGWTRASELTKGSAARGLFALAEKHAYAPAPVSRQELDGRPPDLVFEKQCNTLVKRHHVRLWGGFDGPGGTPLWLGAATHDVGIVWSRAQHGFTHRVEDQIDRERSKIVADLEFTGLVAQTALVERSAAPRRFTHPAGESIETDGRIAVVVLGPRAPAGAIVASLDPAPLN